MKKNQSQRITLEALARMTAQGFAATATKQDIIRLEKRITRLEGLAEEQGNRIAAIDAKLDRALFKEIARLEELIRQLARKTNVTLEY